MSRKLFFWCLICVAIPVKVTAQSSCGYRGSQVTYHNAVKAVLDKHCVSCHAPRLKQTASAMPAKIDGAYSVDPFSVDPANLVFLHKWNDVDLKKDRIIARVANRTMPPTQTQPPLSPTERTAITMWSKKRGHRMPYAKIESVTPQSNGVWEIRYSAAAEHPELDHAADAPVAPATHVALRVRERIHSDFQIYEDCLPVGNNQRVTLRSSDNPIIARFGSYLELQVCAYDRNNVFCDPWPEALYRAP